MAISQYDLNDVLPVAPVNAVNGRMQKVDDLDTEIRSISWNVPAPDADGNLGVVKGDGVTITVDDDGTMHATGAGSLSHTEPLCFDGAVLIFDGDVLMIGVDY
jgi:hypothetical protein